MKKTRPAVGTDPVAQPPVKRPFLERLSGERQAIEPRHAGLFAAESQPAVAPVVTPLSVPVPNQPAAQATKPAPPSLTGPVWTGASSPHHLNQILTQIAPALPLLSERTDLPDPDHVQGLITRLSQASSSAEVVTLARRLPRSALSLAFHALVQSPAPLDSKTVDRLLLILRERACPSLYTETLSIWQQHYPHAAASKALAILCGILEIKRDDTAPNQAGQFPLLGEWIDLNSPHLLKRLIERLVHQPLAICDWMTRFGIIPEWTFGRLLMTEALASGNAAQFCDLVDRLESLFETAAPALQARMMHHFLSLSELPADVRQQASVAFYVATGEPGNTHPVWALLGDKDRRAFSHFVKQARIGSHCRQQPEKAQFYLRYLNQLRQVVPWDDQTMLFYFDRYVIADDQREPDQALFYCGPVPTPHPGGIAHPDQSLSPASPAIAHHQVSEILRNGQIEGIIQIRFDSEGIREAGVLIDFALQSQTQSGLFGRMRRF